MKSDVLSFGEFMFCIMLGMGLMLGVVTSIMWIVDNWDDIVVRYKMWSILKFPRRIVFFRRQIYIITKNRSLARLSIDV